MRLLVKLIPSTLIFFLIPSIALSQNYVPTTDADTLLMRLQEHMGEINRPSSSLLKDLTDAPGTLQKLLFSPETVAFISRLRGAYGYDFRLEDYPELIDFRRDSLVMKAIFDPTTVGFYRRYELQFELDATMILSGAVIAHSPAGGDLLRALRADLDYSADLGDGRQLVSILADSELTAALLDSSFTGKVRRELIEDRGFVFSLWDSRIFHWLLSDTANLALLDSVTDQYGFAPGRIDLGELRALARDAELRPLLFAPEVMAAYDSLRVHFGHRLHLSQLGTLYRLEPHIEALIAISEALEESYGYRFALSDHKKLLQLARNDSLLKLVHSPRVKENFLKLRQESFGCEFSLSRVQQLPNLLNSDMGACFGNNDNYLYKRLSLWPDWSALLHHREALEARIKEILSVQTTLRRKSLQIGGYGQSNDVSLLSSIDLIKSALALEWMDMDETRRWVAGVITQDIANPYTEAGGALFLDSTGAIFADIRPSLDIGDSLIANNVRYRWPREVRVATSLMTVHFHARDDDETSHAGPSAGMMRGDLTVSNYMGIDGMVITKLKGPYFNADFYDDRGNVLDLGVYEMPYPLDNR